MFAVNVIRSMIFFVLCMVVSYFSLELIPDLSFGSFFVIITTVAVLFYADIIWKSLPRFPFTRTLLVSGLIGYATLRHFQGKYVANVTFGAMVMILIIIYLCYLVPGFIGQVMDASWKKEMRKPNEFRT